MFPLRREQERTPEGGGRGPLGRAAGGASGGGLYPGGRHWAEAWEGRGGRGEGEGPPGGGPAAPGPAPTPEAERWRAPRPLGPRAGGGRGRGRGGVVRAPPVSEPRQPWLPPAFRPWGPVPPTGALVPPPGRLSARRLEDG